MTVSVQRLFTGECEPPQGPSRVNEVQSIAPSLRNPREVWAFNAGPFLIKHPLSHRYGAGVHQPSCGKKGAALTETLYGLRLHWLTTAADAQVRRTSGRFCDLIPEAATRELASRNLRRGKYPVECRCLPLQEPGLPVHDRIESSWRTAHKIAFSRARSIRHSAARYDGHAQWPLNANAHDSTLVDVGSGALSSAPSGICRSARGHP